MPLFSASEDFARRTLSAIPGLLSRLAYMTSLRDEQGNYCHWGLVTHPWKLLLPRKPCAARTWKC